MARDKLVNIPFDDLLESLKSSDNNYAKELIQYFSVSEDNDARSRYPGGFESSLRQMAVDTRRGNGFYQAYLSLKWPCSIPETESLADLMVLVNNSVTMPPTPMEACSAHQTLLKIFKFLLPGLGCHEISPWQPFGDAIAFLSQADDGTTVFNIFVSNMGIGSTDQTQLILPGFIVAAGKLTPQGYEFHDFSVSSDLLKQYIFGELTRDLKKPNSDVEELSYYQELQRRLLPDFEEDRNYWVEHVRAFLPKYNSGEKRLTEQQEKLLFSIHLILGSLPAFNRPEDFLERIGKLDDLESIHKNLPDNEQAFVIARKLSEELLQAIRNGKLADYKQLSNPALFPLLLQNYLIFMAYTASKKIEVDRAYAVKLHATLKHAMEIDIATQNRGEPPFYPKWISEKIMKIVTEPVTNYLEFLNAFTPNISYGFGSFNYLKQLDQTVVSLPALGPFILSLGEKGQSVLEHMYTHELNDFSDSSWFKPLLELHQLVAPLIDMSGYQPLKCLQDAEPFLNLPEDVKDHLFKPFIKDSLDCYVRQLAVLVKCFANLNNQEVRDAVSTVSLKTAFDKALQSVPMLYPLKEAIIEARPIYLAACLLRLEAIDQEYSQRLYEAYKKSLKEQILILEEVSQSSQSSTLTSVKPFSEKFEQFSKDYSIDNISSEKIDYSQLIAFEHGLKVVQQACDDYEKELAEQEKRLKKFISLFSSDPSVPLESSLKSFLSNVEEVTRQFRFKWLQLIPKFAALSDKEKFEEFKESLEADHIFNNYTESVTYESWQVGSVSIGVISTLRAEYAGLHADDLDPAFKLFNEFDDQIFDKLRAATEAIEAPATENNAQLLPLADLYLWATPLMGDGSFDPLKSLNELPTFIPKELIIRLLEQPLVLTNDEDDKSNQTLIDYINQIKMLQFYMDNIKKGLSLLESFNVALESIQLSKKLKHAILKSKSLYFTAALHSNSDQKPEEKIALYEGLRDSIRAKILGYKNFLDENECWQAEEHRTFLDEADKLIARLSYGFPAADEEQLEAYLVDIDHRFFDLSQSFQFIFLDFTKELIESQFDAYLPACIKDEIMHKICFLNRGLQEYNDLLLQDQQACISIIEQSKNNYHRLFDKNLYLYLQANDRLSRELSSLYEAWVQSGFVEANFNTYLELVDFTKICRTPRRDIATQLVNVLVNPVAHKDIASYLLELTLREHPLSDELAKALTSEKNIQYFKNQLVNTHFAYDSLFGFTAEELSLAADNLDKNFFDASKKLIEEKVNYLANLSNRHDHYSLLSFRQFYTNRLADILQKRTEFGIGPCYGWQSITGIKDFDTRLYAQEMFFTALGISTAVAMLTFSVVLLSAAVATTLPFSIPASLAIGTMAISAKALTLAVGSVGSLIGSTLLWQQVSTRLAISDHYLNVQNAPKQLIEEHNKSFHGDSLKPRSSLDVSYEASLFQPDDEQKPLGMSP